MLAIVLFGNELLQVQYTLLCYFSLTLSTAACSPPPPSPPPPRCLLPHTGVRSPSLASHTIPVTSPLQAVSLPCLLMALWLHNPV